MTFHDTAELADLGSCIVRYRRNKHELDIFQMGSEADGFTPQHIVISGDKSIETLCRVLAPKDKLRPV